MNRKDEALIRKIARTLYRKYCPMAESGFFTEADIFHYGVIGFMDAKKRFDPGKCVPFSAYAAIRIQGEIMDALRKGPQVRLPQAKQARVKELLAAKNQLADQGIPPTEDRLADLLGWDENEIRGTEKLMVTTRSTDQNPMLALVRDRDDRREQEQHLLAKDLSRVMQKCLDGLGNPRERMILVSRQVKGMKLRQLADKFGCALETIRQWEIRAKTHMRKCLETHGWHLE